MGWIFINHVIFCADWISKIATTAWNSFNIRPYGKVSNGSFLETTNMIEPKLYMDDLLQEEFQDSKNVIRSRKSKKDRRHNGQKKKDKQRSTKHNTEN